MKRVGPNLPWFSAVVLYGAGIVFIFFQSSTLESDAAKVAALAIQAVLAGGIVHGITRMRGIIRDVGEAIDRSQPPGGGT